eukprot:8259836-Pyramimonas_sp.AAC.1
MQHGVQRLVAPAKGRRESEALPREGRPLRHVMPSDILGTAVDEEGVLRRAQDVDEALGGDVWLNHILSHMHRLGLVSDEPGAPLDESQFESRVKDVTFTLPLQVNVNLSSNEGGREVVDTIQQFLDNPEEVLMFGDQVPFGQVLRMGLQHAMRDGKQYFAKMEAGFLHFKMHVLEGYSKLGWDLGLRTLAGILGQVKVQKDVVKGIWDCEDKFMRTVQDGMWEAALREWAQRSEVAKSSTAPPIEKVQDFLSYMARVCEEKPAACFWWDQMMRQWGFYYLALADAIRRGDAVLMESIVRKVIPLFKFTKKLKYVNLGIFMLVDWQIMPPRLLSYFRYNRTNNMSGRMHCSVAMDYKVERLNDAQKKCCLPGTSARKLIQISGCADFLESTVEAFEGGTQAHRKKKGTAPSTTLDSQRVAELCLRVGLFSDDPSVEAPLMDLFATVPPDSPHPERYLSVVQHTIATIAVTGEKILNTKKEAELAILVNKVKRDGTVIIERGYIRLPPDPVAANVAHVLTWEAAEVDREAKRARREEEHVTVDYGRAGMCRDLPEHYRTFMEHYMQEDQAMVAKAMRLRLTPDVQDAAPAASEDDVGAMLRGVPRLTEAVRWHDLRLVEVTRPQDLLLGGVRVSYTFDECRRLAIMHFLGEAAQQQEIEDATR